jgi:hypothetical protein
MNNARVETDRAGLKGRRSRGPLTPARMTTRVVERLALSPDEAAWAIGVSRAGYGRNSGKARRLVRMRQPGIFVKIFSRGCHYRALR